MTRTAADGTGLATTSPVVTVVVPVRDEQDRIEECLERILAQSYPADRLEILVVDGGSRDGTREVVERVSHNGHPPGAVSLLANPRGQRASGLNVGIQAARGDVIVRVDARSVIPPNYIERCVQTLYETGADNVGGVQQPIARSATQEAIGMVLSHRFGVGNAAFRLGRSSGFVDTVYLGCFRRDVFDKIGLFDDRGAILSEDSDINQRIRQAGGRVYLNADIRVLYYPRETFAAFWRIAFRYGGARAGNLLKHRRFTAWRQVVPPAFVVSLVGLAALSLVDRRFLAPLAGLGGLYAVAVAAISARLAWRRRPWRLAPRLLVAFPLLHFGWALGFWSRLLARPHPGARWRY